MPLDGRRRHHHAASSNHTIVDGSYVRPVDLLPGYQYPWPFTWHIDTFTTPGAAPAAELARPLASAAPRAASADEPVHFGRTAST